MDRNEIIEDLQDQISKSRIEYLTQLQEYCYKEGIEPFEDCLSPMEWNSCDRCDRLCDSQLGLCWLEGLDQEEDKSLINALAKEHVDYCAICWPCVQELKKEKYV